MINDDFSTFKRHSAWFAQRGSQTLHDAHAGELEDFWRRRESASRAAKLPDWECLGPFNIAGRVTTLIAHPADPRRLWAGAAAGGVWRSADGGANWQSCWPKWASQNIGALAIDPADPKLIYCATGEAMALLVEGDISLRRREMLARRQRTDDWYFERFGMKW